MCVINYNKVIINKAYTPTKKNGYKTGLKPKDDRQLYIKGCNCGWCYECRQKNANQWRVRLKEEVKNNEFKNMIFATFTFSEEWYAKLAKEVRGDNIKKYNEIAGEIDNEVAAKAIRYWSEAIRAKYKKQPRRWLVTERGSRSTERVHIHGIIFTDIDNDNILKSWRYGRADDGRSTGKKGWVNEQTINYITKYVFKTDETHVDFKGRIFASAGIGRSYIEDKTNIYRHRFQGIKTNTTYTDSQGYKCGLPKYYRDRLYTEEQRRELWSIQLDKQEDKIVIDGVEYTNDKENQFTINQAYINNERKNIELGYIDRNQFKIVQQINRKKREIIGMYKVVKELKKENKDYGHIKNKMKEEQEVLKMLNMYKKRYIK